MDEKFESLTDKARAVALLMGYNVNHCISISRVTYNWLSETFGKSSVDELIDSGILFIPASWED